MAPPPPAPAIALTGTFDVRNYGDLLFPLIAAWRLARHGIRVEAYSPVGTDTGWADTIAPRPIAALAEAWDRYAAFLIGGGNIIHLRSASLPDYPEAIDRWAYPGLWAGAARLGALTGRAVLWNAPGVPHRFSDEARAEIVAPALAESAYVSVRDRASRSYLKHRGVAVVPDTAVEIAAMWPRETLAGHWAALLARKRMAAGRYVAIHIKARAIDAGGEAGLAALLDGHAAATGRTPLLVAIGQCHGDHLVAQRVGAAMAAPHLLLDDPLGLKEIAAAIAGAEAYIGCSLHGYITAFAYGRPGRIVARPRLIKQDGFLAQIGREADLFERWAEALAPRPEQDSGESAAALAGLAPALDRHWRRIARETLGARERA
ncbi:polysaccharide pyruvyl transferase family protein [Sphingomonas hengshuiensis]|uniref:Polysaccharide pyruvyl transferase domain-containing protein n=1 Tax=Sphingomonas hengshuiensis TaxID=1609977 RepID=A0A7U4LFK0_9SPHN|nr:polysaccharide pyruvyl transferase family protein [Sphingomonas hengshuiensis]AJP72609.1 hypothetical protein TS85_13760 [Sphingomonas hengshuiensis]